MTTFISCTEAKSKKLTRYFTNKPCKNGHVSERLVSNRSCVDCHNERDNKSYYDNQEKRIAKSRKWNDTHPEKHLEHVHSYARNNTNKIRAHNAKHRADKLQRTPLWANLDKIQQFYTEATHLTQETGTKYHVDHVIPLRGKTVSGLHVENNIQVIPAIVNLKKGNRLGV